MLSDLKWHPNLTILSIILLFTGDLLYFGSLLFPDTMVEVILRLSYYTKSDFSDPGLELLLFFMATLGALMYLTGFLVLSLDQEWKNQKILVIIGLVIWFIADSIGSLIWNFPFNAVSNMMFLIVGILFLMRHKSI